MPYTIDFIHHVHGLNCSLSYTWHKHSEVSVEGLGKAQLSKIPQYISQWTRQHPETICCMQFDPEGCWCLTTAPIRMSRQGFGCGGNLFDSQMCG